MTKKEEALFQTRLARHLDELRWQSGGRQLAAQ